MKILNELPPEVKKGQMVSMDFETFGQIEGKLHRPNGTFACISICIEGQSNTVYQLYDKNDLRKLYQVVKKGTPVFHNALYDLRQFRRYVDFKPTFIWDTMLIEQSMWGGYYRTFGLDDLSRRILGRLLVKDVREDFSTFTEMTPRMKTYAARDAQYTLEIALIQRREYIHEDAFNAYRVADEPMIFPVLDMPGMRVDVGKWTEMVNGFQDKATQLEQELGFNVKSPQQVKAAAAREKIHLLDTSNETLTAFSDKPLIAKVIEARLYRDAVSKYGLKWLESHVESDGKVYSDYHISGASQTGRMSSSNPNGQNIPQRKLPQYRTNFISSEGNVIEIDDVHQQEPCILAWESKDAVLIKAIEGGEDLHLAVARQIFDEPKMKKDDPRRDIGKTINLGTAYGLSAYGLASRLHITDEQAEGFLQKYFRKFSGVASWITQERRMGYALEYVSTALGRRSFLNIHDRKWQNNAINSPIQGGAADLTKVWGRKIWEMSRQEGIPYTIVGFIHDEIVRDTPKEVLKKSAQIKHRAFREAAELLYPGVPFKFESVSGRSWGAKKIKSEMILEEE